MGNQRNMQAERESMYAKGGKVTFPIIKARDGSMKEGSMKEEALDLKQMRGSTKKACK